MDEVESAKAELKTELEAVKQQLTEAAGNRAGIEAARDEAALQRLGELLVVRNQV